MAIFTKSWSRNWNSVSARDFKMVEDFITVHKSYKNGNKIISVNRDNVEFIKLINTNMMYCSGRLVMQGWGIKNQENSVVNTKQYENTYKLIKTYLNEKFNNK
jgi:poly(A) polymerase Pap1